MARQDFDGKFGAFALGVGVGLLLNSVGKEMYERVRTLWWHREYERTVTYDENLPEQLGRREPAPRPGQPRFGGTGAIGVHPATVAAAQPTPPETAGDE